MDETEMARHARDLQNTADIACVTTVDQHGRPQSRGMFNLHNHGQFPALRAVFPEDSFETWFTTNTASAKMADLTGNRAVSVYYCRPTDWRGLTLGGDMEIITDPVEKRRLWQEGWELYYPLGPDDPDHTVLRLRPTWVKYYHQLKTAVLVG